MRVLIVASYSLPHLGGVEVLVDQEAGWLAQQGHHVRIITSDGGEGECPLYQESIQLVRVPCWNFTERRLDIPWPIYSPRIFFTIWHAVSQCDMIHAHGFINATTSLAFLMARLRKKPPKLVLTEHAGRSCYQQRWKKWLLEIAILTFGRIAVRLADQCYTCHPRVRKLLEELTGQPAKVNSLLFPLALSKFPPASDGTRQRARETLGWDQLKRYVLYVGRITKRKGLDLLLQMPSSDFQLVLCGPGEPADVVDRDVGRNVSFLAARPQAELLDLYYAADLLVLPSRSEGNFPLVVQEALLCGLPVLLGNELNLESFSSCAGVHFCRLEPLTIHQAILDILQVGFDPSELRLAVGKFFPRRNGMGREDNWVTQITG